MRKAKAGVKDAGDSQLQLGSRLNLQDLAPDDSYRTRFTRRELLLPPGFLPHRLDLDVSASGFS